MAGRPVTIRLLDPPLHEFLPHEDAAVAEVAKASGLAEEQVRARSLKLIETNPMLGHRGCRLGIPYPEISEMKARAIFEAVAAGQKETGETVKPEEIGRASCRERVCQYVSISVVAVSLKKK